MRVTRYHLAATSIALAAALTTGCGDPAGPRTGAIVISVSTPGSPAYWDLDGYTLKIDDGASQVVASNAIVTIADLPTGDHLVRLEGVAPNCSVSGTNPRFVEVKAGDVFVSFSVTCGARTGTVRVSTTTSGPEPDTDGYSLVVGARVSSGVPANGTFEMAGVPEGEHSAALSGVSENCAVDAPHPRTVSIANGEVMNVAFVIRCVAKAALHVTTTTSGVEPDGNGYAIRLAQPGGYVTTVNVAANSSVTIPLQSGTYTVTVLDIEPNCDVVTSNERVVTLTAGNQTPITVDIKCEAPKQLAYVNFAGSQTDIYLTNSNGTALIRLITDGEDGHPAWSPNGSRIAFTNYRSGMADIYVMDANGANQVRLTVGGGDYYPAWSPDGSKIAFTSRRTGTADIYVMNADGTNPVRLTTDNALDEAPAWSPDGLKIAFHSMRGGTAGIWVMNADGSAPTRLTSNTQGDYQPAWSPDGTRIAFSSGGDIYVMNADGSGRIQLTEGYRWWEDAWGPVWSPTGGKIAFTDFSYYGNSSIVVISSEGIPYAPLRLPGSVSDPAWRP